MTQEESRIALDDIRLPRYERQPGGEHIAEYAGYVGRGPLPADALSDLLRQIAGRSNETKRCDFEAQPRGWLCVTHDEMVFVSVAGPLGEPPEECGAGSERVGLTEREKALLRALEWLADQEHARYHADDLAVPSRAACPVDTCQYATTILAGAEKAHLPGAS